ncbi:hypothetical protein CDD81_6060 [Ophiocordyceps australis]|uniref:Cyclin n=1 Tax=Ophiocordyceps australis TaxID=1399860 RepID=A0A2C5Y6V4_9HYPO|nr:hypothetical protein CDD81_6060 [Ophiocordyceps australis]
MAAVVGDFVSDLSRLHHSMIVKPSSLPTQQPQSQRRHHATASPRLLEDSTLPPHRSASRSRHKAAATARSPRRDGDARHCDDDELRQPASSASDSHCAPCEPLARGTSPIPSPPPSVVAGPPTANHDQGDSSSMTKPQTAEGLGVAQPQLRQDMTASPGRQQPSPPVDDFRIPLSHADASHASKAVSACCSLPDADATPTPQPEVVHIRDLAHLGALAADGAVVNGAASAAGPPTKFEISAMPIGDVIEMVAALLTKITLTNDKQHDATQRNAAHQQQASQTNDSAQMSPLSHSVLAFHGKNVPTINIASYLSRIHKYCPTTYEVFLSLLVYFDRMTERVNDLMMKNDESTGSSLSRPMSSHQLASQSDMAASEGQDGAQSAQDSDSARADSDYTAADSTPQQGASIINASEQLPAGPTTYFVVDSYNIHRLVIAGVTCASKFFSDVFYTNSRYAKVGGLPLAELNHLEIQFLVLNDFRLAVTVEELEAYGTMLVEFYAREVLASKMGPREWSGAQASFANNADGR